VSHVIIRSSFYLRPGKFGAFLTAYSPFPPVRHCPIPRYIIPPFTFAFPRLPPVIAMSSSGSATQPRRSSDSALPLNAQSVPTHPFQAITLRRRASYPGKGIPCPESAVLPLTLSALQTLDPAVSRCGSRDSGDYSATTQEGSLFPESSAVIETDGTETPQGELSGPELGRRTSVEFSAEDNPDKREIYIGRLYFPAQMVLMTGRRKLRNRC
jgi:hypothetical protein